MVVPFAMYFNIRPWEMRFLTVAEFEQFERQAIEISKQKR